jgi:hypothetical protein
MRAAATIAARAAAASAAAALAPAPLASTLTTLTTLRPPSVLLQGAREGRRRAASTAASSAAAAASSNPQRPNNQKHPRTTPFLLTLERSVGARGPVADAPLCATGAFGAEVSPDLPIATSWEGLGRAAARRARGVLGSLTGNSSSSGGQEGRDLSAAVATTPTTLGDPTAWRVATVAAQVRSPEELERRLVLAAGAAASGGGGADALLLVSGSHPLRSIPPLAAAVAGARVDSLDLLRTAARLRDDPLLAAVMGGGGGDHHHHGRLPRGLALWAVANPVTERDASRSAAKAAAGAEALLTQPPLDWTAFERWLEDARRRGLGLEEAAVHQSRQPQQQRPPPAGSARLVVGFPCLSSSANARFWVELCGAPRNGPAAEATTKAFADAERRLGGPSSADFAAWALAWNRALASRLVGLPGVGGLHVMPVTAAGKRIALGLLAEGALTLPPPAAAAAAAADKGASDEAAGRR